MWRGSGGGWSGATTPEPERPTPSAAAATPAGTAHHRTRAARHGAPSGRKDDLGMAEVSRPHVPSGCAIGWPTPAGCCCVPPVPPVRQDRENGDQEQDDT